MPLRRTMNVLFVTLITMLIAMLIMMLIAMLIFMLIVMLIVVVAYVIVAFIESHTFASLRWPGLAPCCSGLEN